MIWSRIDKALEEAVLPVNPEMAAEYQKRKFVSPGAVLLVGQGGDIVYHKAFGCRSILPEVTPLDKEMVFDIASLTKALGTSLLTMRFVDQGKLSIDRKVSHILQGFGSYGKERITLKHLLTHSSGLPAHVAFYKKIAQLSKQSHSGLIHSREATDMVYREIVRSKTEHLPGRAVIYSDVGFILLGAALEVVGGGISLAKLISQQVLNPLKLLSSGFIELDMIDRGLLNIRPTVIVPTARCPWRERILVGEVHDDNSWVMGGVAGHAGLFATARDIHYIARELLECYRGKGRFVARETLQLFWKKDETIENSSWALGWDTPSPEESSSGHYLSRAAVGHLGFTGCSLWIDPIKEINIILLTNRIHPTADNETIKRFRPMIHDLIMETLGYSSQ